MRNLINFISIVNQVTYITSRVKLTISVLKTKHRKCQGYTIQDFQGRKMNILTTAKQKQGARKNLSSGYHRCQGGNSFFFLLISIKCKMRGEILVALHSYNQH